MRMFISSIIYLYLTSDKHEVNTLITAQKYFSPLLNLKLSNTVYITHPFTLGL